MGADDTERQTDASDPLGDVSSDALAALTEIRRRHVLYYLRERDGADLATLAQVVAGWIGAERSTDLTTSADHDRLEIELHHTHLPKLDSVGLLSYDPDSGYATARPIPKSLDELLDKTRKLERGAHQERPTLRDPPAEIPPFRGGGVRSLRDLVADAERTATTITVFAPDPHEELVEQFSTRNVEVIHEPLPAVADGGFVLVRQDGVALGSVGVDALRSTETASVTPPWENRDNRRTYRQFLSLFRETTFSTGSRRELLATTREIEDRTWRTGEGRLRAGFQSLSAYRDQIDVYRQVGGETDLDVHVYGRPDWTPPSVEGVRLHEEAGSELGLVWFVVFYDDRAVPDTESLEGAADGRESSNSCALIAEERERDQYYGFWTYDHDLVEQIDAYLAETYP
jgi:DICT domain-containing protein